MRLCCGKLKYEYDVIIVYRLGEHYVEMSFMMLIEYDNLTCVIICIWCEWRPRQGWRHAQKICKLLFLFFIFRVKHLWPLQK
jgi:hypothetical protein